VRPPPPGDPLIGRVIDDRYRILTVIGRGGMGVVYEAEATRLGKRRCAVKVLLPEYTRNETAVARFAREAQVAARVKHPNVVEIFDTGATRDGLGYIAMELLQGDRRKLLTNPRQLLVIRLALGTKALELLAQNGVAPSQGLQLRMVGLALSAKRLQFTLVGLAQRELRCPLSLGFALDC
jgi:hypothetical protein